MNEEKDSLGADAAAVWSAGSIETGPRQATDAECRRAKIVMSWSSSQRAVYNGYGFMPGAFKTPEAQEAYRQELVAQLDKAERGE